MVTRNGITQPLPSGMSLTDLGISLDGTFGAQGIGGSFGSQGFGASFGAQGKLSWAMRASVAINISGSVISRAPWDTITVDFCESENSDTVEPI